MQRKVHPEASEDGNGSVRPNKGAVGFASTLDAPLLPFARKSKQFTVSLELPTLPKQASPTPSSLPDQPGILTKQSNQTGSWLRASIAGYEGQKDTSHGRQSAQSELQGSLGDGKLAPRLGWPLTRFQIQTISPDNPWLEKWSWICVAAAVMTGFIQPFLMAFMGSPGMNDGVWELIQWLLFATFALDMISNFFVEFEDPETGARVDDFHRIALNYSRGMFLPDLIYLIPWSTVILAMMGHKDEYEEGPLLLLGLLRLLQLGRLYRLSAFIGMLEYRMILPQVALVLLRNNLYVLGSSHVAGCLFYLIGRVEHFTPETWIGRHGERFENVGIFGKYIYSLYFALAAFTGLGDNDFFVASVPEACVMSAYLLFNLLLAAYILGTVTMLMVKGDKRMKQFRDRVMNLRAYGKMNEIPTRLMTAMESHTELHFHNAQASDEQVLTIYPQTIRRRVLRHLYMDAVKKCYLFEGCSAKFLDAVLSGGRVEQFMPQEQVVAEGDMVNEVYVLLEGQATLASGGVLPKHLAGLSKRAGKKSALSAGAFKRARTAGNHSQRGNAPAGGAGGDGHTAGGLGRPSVDVGGLGRPSMDAGGRASMDADGGLYGGRESLSGNDAGNKIMLRRMDSMGSQHSFNDADTHASTVGLSRSQSLNGSVVSGADEYQGLNTGLGLIQVSDDLCAGSCFGQTSFFAEVAAHSSVWSTSVIKVLVISRLVYQELLSTYPQQTRKVLENTEKNAEEEVRTTILSSLGHSTSLNNDVVTALQQLALRDKKPSELSSATMIEIRALLSKHKRTQLDSLGKVKESLAKYVRKVDQEIVYEFLNSCADGDEATVRSALAAGMSPNCGDYDKRTGLMLACHSGHTDVVRALLEAGADPQLPDNFGGTAMLECVKMGQDHLVNLLVEHGGSLGMEGVVVASQLCDFVKTGNLVQLERMLRAGAPVDAVDYNGCTPLHVACISTNLTAVRMLIAQGVDAQLSMRNAWGRTALEEAERLGDNSIVMFLQPLTTHVLSNIEKQARDMDFLNACSAGKADQVRASLTVGQSPDTADYDTRTGLMLACHAGHVEIAKLLLQGGADANIKDFAGHTAMWECVQMKHPALIDVLLQYQGSLCMGGVQLSAMMCQLVAEKDLAVLLNLIKAGAKPEEADYIGNTPLHVAASLGDLDSVRLLVEEANIQVDVLDGFGRTAHDCAVMRAGQEDYTDYGAHEVMAYLQPLMAAAKKGKIKSRAVPGGIPAVMMMLGGGDIVRLDCNRSPAPAPELSAIRAGEPGDQTSVERSSSEERISDIMQEASSFFQSPGINPAFLAKESLPIGVAVSKASLDVPIDAPFSNPKPRPPSGTPPLRLTPPPTDSPRPPGGEGSSLRSAVRLATPTLAPGALTLAPTALALPPGALASGTLALAPGALAPKGPSDDDVLRLPGVAQPLPDTGQAAEDEGVPKQWNRLLEQMDVELGTIEDSVGNATLNRLKEAAPGS